MENVSQNTLPCNVSQLRLRKQYSVAAPRRFNGRVLHAPILYKYSPFYIHKDVWDLKNTVSSRTLALLNFTKLIEIVKETGNGRVVAEQFLNKQDVSLYDILVIEDDEMSRLVLGMVLRRNYLTCKFAHTPQEAADNFMGDHFQLIMVGIDDPAIAQKGLKELMKRTSVPIVALGSENTQGHIPSYLMRSGFRELLQKPYTESALLQLIHKHMKKEENPGQEMNPDKKSTERFNLDQLNRIGNNDSEFLLKMLDKFVISATECSDALNAALPEKDWQGMKAAAHKSVPSFSLMGLNQMTLDLSFIDKHAGQSEQDEQVLEKVQAVLKDIRGVIKDVNAHMEQLKEEKTNRQ